MKGKAIIFSAPSGAGKTTIVHHLIKQIPNLAFSVSATTRNPRPNEKDGVDYHFLTKEAFHRKVEENEVLEWEEVYQGIYYGTLASEVKRIWEEGNHVIFDLDVKGGIALKERLGDRALSIFVKVDNIDVLRSRLAARETESPETLNERVSKAVSEMQEQDNFDRVLVNHDLQKTLTEAERLVKEFLN